MNKGPTSQGLPPNPNLTHKNPQILPYAILQKWVPYSQRYLFNAIPDTNLTLTLLTLILDTVVNKAPTAVGQPSSNIAFYRFHMHIRNLPETMGGQTMNYCTTCGNQRPNIQLQYPSDIFH